MPTRRLLMTLLGTSVSAFVLASSPALASTPFQPATPWAVSRIDPTNGSAAYCTLARRFSGNTIITFARNANGEGTIAVDFQQPLFSTDETYRIGLQAGDGMQREFMTRPATPNALVLRTGQDPEFFTALSGSTELGVMMDGNRYAFELPDFGTGLNSLSGCLGGTSSPAPAAAQGGTTASINLPDDDKLASMRAELSKLRNENAGIVASLKEQTAEAKPQQQNAESAQLMTKLTSLEQEKNGLVEKLQNGQQQEMQDVSDLKAALEDQKSLKSMLESERAQRQQLESALKTQTADAEKRGEMRARIDQLEASNKELKQLRDAVDTERSKRIAAENALKAQATASLEEQETIRARVADLETRNKTLQQSADQLVATKSQLEDTTAKVTEEQVRRQAAENALKDMSISISKREADMQTLQEKVDIERKQMDAADKAKMAELSQQHADEIARLNAQMEAIKTAQAKDVEDREKMQNQISAETARRQAAEKTVADMQTSISQREADMARLQEQMDLEHTKMEAASAADKAEQAKQHEAEIARLNAQMNDAKAAQAQEIQARADLETKIATEQARREAAEKTVGQLQSQIEEERTKLTASENAKEAELTKKHQDEIARLNDEMARAKAAQQDAASKADDLQATISTEAARRAAAEKAMSEYQNKVSDERKELSKAEQQKEAELAKQHQDEIAKLNEELALIKTAQADEINKAKTAAATESARREATEKELQQAKEQLASAQDAAKSGGTEISAKMADMQTQMAQLEQTNTKLMSDLKSAQEGTHVAEANAVKADTKDSTNADARIAAVTAKAEADKKRTAGHAGNRTAAPRKNRRHAGQGFQ